jgi:hypothetical protein
MVRFRAQTYATIGGSCCGFPDPADTVCTASSYATRNVPYLGPRLDNVMLLPKTTYLSNQELEQVCLYADSIAVFQFPRLEPSAFVFRDFFDTGASPGWKLSDGASFVSNLSAARNAGDMQHPFSGPGGCLGFGSETNRPQLPECCPGSSNIVTTASASIVIGGLRSGEEYALSYWWKTKSDTYCDTVDFVREGDLWVEVFDCPVVMQAKILPNSINLNSHGKWITATIEPPAGYSIGDIDISSILLQGSVPLFEPPQIGDFDQDGIQELKMRFDRASLQSVLSPGNSVPITVSGRILDTCFEATRLVRVHSTTLAVPAAGSVLSPGDRVAIV